MCIPTVLVSNDPLVQDVLALHQLGGGGLSAESLAERAASLRAKQAPGAFSFGPRAGQNFEEGANCKICVAVHMCLCSDSLCPEAVRARSVSTACRHSSILKVSQSYMRTHAHFIFLS